ncbi:hypothetical protein SAMN03097708_02181 [Thiohalomonas denitrificans]|uniref:Uncharacterized protein n=1 Tax=Thiohalomonas denitrificans TaxID=415747 RepID=A0A1G5QIK7_9GAMM|nr:hypothetical protein SAMN03097708_02181 [Thiohalomonas denitrificans]
MAGAGEISISINRQRMSGSARTQVPGNGSWTKSSIAWLAEHALTHASKYGGGNDPLPASFVKGYRPPATVGLPGSSG